MGWFTLCARLPYLRVLVWLDFLLGRSNLPRPWGQGASV